jgi:hypothetical protein
MPSRFQVIAHYDICYTSHFLVKYGSPIVLSPQWHIAQLVTMLGDDEYSKVKFEIVVFNNGGIF